MDTILNRFSNGEFKYYDNEALERIMSTIKQLNFSESNIVNVLHTDKQNEIKLSKDCSAIINMECANNFRYINKMHEHVNNVLPLNGIYVTCYERLIHRRERIREKYHALTYFPRLFLDFIWHRVLQKLPVIRKFYFSVTRGKNRPLSKAEGLGRVISCGFEILDTFELNKKCYIVSKKSSEPSYDMNASFNMVFKMKRIGYHGKIVYVYKMRTMHPFSEYVQDYIIKENNLHSKGKINNDYRVTNWGKFMRKYWLDEMPMIFNLIKGELNLVGVRPLSTDFYSRYPKDLQDLRIKFKPGLIPPYYADLPDSFDAVLESEREYLRLKLKNPLSTDLKYICKAFVNIFMRGARSN